MIYIQHTSFRLYYCCFPVAYLSSLYHTGEPPPPPPEGPESVAVESAGPESGGTPSPSETGGVTLLRTREYDFADSSERAGWFDIFVALVRYLLSGESKVGYLNGGRGKENPIHKPDKKKVLAPEKW